MSDRCGWSGKIRYKKKANALDALARCRVAIKTHKRREQRTYFCPRCGGWHLTKQRLLRKED